MKKQASTWHCWRTSQQLNDSLTCLCLCRFVFQFSLMSLFPDLDPGECADCWGLPPSTGWLWDGGRAARHGSVGITSEFKWSRGFADSFEDFPGKIHSQVFVWPCTHTHTHTVLYMISSCPWTPLMPSLRTPRDKLLMLLNPFILQSRTLSPKEGKHLAPGHPAFGG